MAKMKKIDWRKVVNEAFVNAETDLNDRGSGLLADVEEKIGNAQSALAGDNEHFDEIQEKIGAAMTEAKDLECLGRGIHEELGKAWDAIDAERAKRKPPTADLTIAGTIKLEPNWDNLRAWFLNIKRTDLKQYRKMLAADKSGQTARWLGEPWPLPKKLED